MQNIGFVSTLLILHLLQKSSKLDFVRFLLGFEAWSPLYSFHYSTRIEVLAVQAWSLGFYFRTYMEVEENQL